MSMRLSRWLAPALVMVALILPLTARVASAHGRTTVGDYELVIGFHNEPAYQGEPNGLDLFITNTKTNQPVNDLADTLQAEIIFGSAKKELEVRPQFGRDGAYTADILPTEAGDYTWHIWGDIEGTAVDVSMASGPETFGAVEAKGAVAFPAAEATPAELRAQAAAAAGTARTALIVGGIGSVLGLIGTVVGFMGLRARRSGGAVGETQRAV